MPTTEYALPLNETKGTPIAFALEASPMQASITPEAQLELAQSGSIVMALFALYLIAHETRLILQTIFLSGKTQGNNGSGKPMS